MSSDRVMRWRLLLEEYGPTFKYIKGEKNIVADALSRQDTHSTDPIKNNDENLEFLYAFEPIPEEIKFPMEIKKLVRAQNEDMHNNAKFQKIFKNNKNISINELQGKNIIFLNKKIFVPKSL